MQRRGFLFGGALLLAAPALVRADSLMRVKPWAGEMALLRRGALGGWHPVANAAGIDVAALNTAHAPDLFTAAANLLLNANVCAPDSYRLSVSREIRLHMDIQAMRSRNVLTQWHDNGYHPVDTFRGVQIELQG